MIGITNINGISKITKTAALFGDLGGLPPFPTDLSFDFNARTDYLIDDSINSEDAEVVGGYEAISTATNEITLPAPYIIDYDFILKVDIRSTDTTSNAMILGGSTWGGDGILVYNSGVTGTLRLYYTNTEFVDWTGVTSLSGITIEKTGSNFTLNGVPSTSNSYAGASTFIDALLNRLQNDLGIVGECGTISLYNKDTATLIFEYHLNNHSRCSCDNVPATNNGVTFELNNTDKLESTLSALNNGYYTLSTGEKVINPQYTKPVDAELIAGGKVHNLIDSYIKFPTGIMDRSDATRFNATCRSSIYYDAAQPTLWHISELDFDTISSYQESAYFDTIFAGYNVNYGDKKELFEVFGYTTPKENDDLVKVLNYCNYNYLPSGYEYELDSNGNKQYDANGSILVLPIP